MKLILISDFMQDEIYLTKEVEYYDKFDQVYYFSVKGHVYPNKRLEMVGNIQAGALDISYTSNLHRISCLIKGIFNINFTKELLKLIKTKKFSNSSLKQLLLFSSKKELLKKPLRSFINNFDKTEKLVFYSYRLGIGTMAALELVKPLKNAKVISRGHGQDILEFRGKNDYLPYRDYIYSKIDKFFAISDDGRNYLINKYPVLKDKSVTSRLGTTKINILNQAKNKPFTIVTCSRIVPIKRLELLIESLKDIQSDLEWVHFGIGEDKYAEDIIHSAQGLPKNIKVVFKGFVDNNQLKEEYSKLAASVFVNVSESEGLPVSIMEACSVGMPIIATNVGGTSEIVKHGINGYLLEKDFNKKELTNTIQKIMMMEENEFIEMSNNSYLVWKENFNVDENYSNFVRSLLEL